MYSDVGEYLRDEVRPPTHPASFLFLKLKLKTLTDRYLACPSTGDPILETSFICCLPFLPSILLDARPPIPCTTSFFNLPFCVPPALLRNDGLARRASTCARSRNIRLLGIKRRGKRRKAQDEGNAGSRASGGGEHNKKERKQHPLESIRASHERRGGRVERVLVVVVHLCQSRGRRSCSLVLLLVRVRRRKGRRGRFARRRRRVRRFGRDVHW